MLTILGSSAKESAIFLVQSFIIIGQVHSLGES
jgi:hypothetical protein